MKKSAETEIVNLIEPGIGSPGPIGPYQEISKTHRYFRGFVNPSPIQKAKIYRAYAKLIQSVQAEILHCFMEQYQINILNSVIIPPTDTFDVYLNQSDDYIFIPPSFENIEETELEYNRRLLNDFIKCESLDGEILQAPGTLLFVSFKLIQDMATIMKTWFQFIGNGILRKFIIPMKICPQLFDIFPWKANLRFRFIDPEIEVSCICNSKSIFLTYMSKLNHSSKQRIHIHRLKSIIKDENVAYGICKLYGVHDLLPLIGTDIMLTTYTKILPEIIFSNIDSTDIEVFLQMPINKMDRYEKESLIKLNNKHYYTFMNLYESRNERNEVRDPMTREVYSMDEFKDYKIDNMFLDMFWKETSKMCEPNLTIISNSGTIKFCFTINGGGVPMMFWEIPETMEQSDYAVNVILQKWDNKSLFESKRLGVDPYLIFMKKALYIFCKPIAKNNNELVAQAKFLSLL